jgi:hypothetical protein
MYKPLAAAKRTALLNMVNGNMNWATGDKLFAKTGVNRVTGAKGKATAMHIRAFESAPPNAPE